MRAGVEAVTNQFRVTLEFGPKGKKVVAVAPDWPGLSRGANTEAAALERLLDYRPRYARVAQLAGMNEAYAASSAASSSVEVIERYPGTGSTDFWGISYGFSSHDRQQVSVEGLERELSLMRGCWTFFDEVRSRVSAELQKGPRGGGRDRDQIVRHTMAAERDWAKGLGLIYPQDTPLSDEALAAHRNAYCEAIRTFHSENRPSGKWPLRYLIRHTAYHTLDHAWEMEDKDLTAGQGPAGRTRSS